MTDIQDMNIDQTRAAAQELLDSTVGDLAGQDAERFEALRARADQLHKQERQRRVALHDMVHRMGTGRTARQAR